jgi:hypothetical protein
MLHAPTASNRFRATSVCRLGRLATVLAGPPVTLHGFFNLAGVIGILLPMLIRNRGWDLGPAGRTHASAGPLPY